MERKHLDLTVVDTPLGEVKMYSVTCVLLQSLVLRLPNMYKKTARGVPAVAAAS